MDLVFIGSSSGMQQFLRSKDRDVEFCLLLSITVIQF